MRVYSKCYNCNHHYYQHRKLSNDIEYHVPCSDCGCIEYKGVHEEINESIPTEINSVDRFIEDTINKMRAVILTEKQAMKFIHWICIRQRVK